MKEFEENVTEGWTIYPPEDAQKARRWMKAIDAAISPARDCDDREATEGRGKTRTALDRPMLREGEKYS